MKNFKLMSVFLCGLLLMLAAFPVLSQESPVDKVEFNQKPLVDLVEFTKEKIVAEKIDLTKPFSVEVMGILTKDGKLDSKESKFVKISGDEKMIEVGKSFIEAIGYTGLFVYFKNLGIDKMNLTVGQDESESYINIVSEQKSPERGRTVSSAFKALVTLALIVDKDGSKKMTDAERFLIGGLKASNEGNKVILNFTYQKSAVQEMIKRSLQK